MSGTIKLTGSADQHWDETLENADHSIETRLIGKEDIYWDSDGKGEQGSFVDRTGTDRPITMLNASHIPLPTAVREACDGAENIAEGMLKLSQMAGVGGGPGGMTEDKSVTIEASFNHEQKQTLIDSQTRNLGGHTLTFAFPEAIDLFFNDSLTFSGFYNGSLVIDLNGITISDNINLTKLFSFCDCLCKAEIRNGTLKHTLSQYAVLAERCPNVYLTDLIFIGSGLSANYAFCGVDSDGYATGCTYGNDQTVMLSGFGSDDASSKASAGAASAVNTHNSSGSAHSALFAGKANSSHTHTPSQAGADPAGTASSAVNTHNTATTAHSGILAPLANPVFSGVVTAPTPARGDNSTKVATTAFVATAVNAASGIVDRDVSAHNASATAHSGILAPLASPILTGTPKAPTAVTGTSTDQLATTKFVQNNIAATTVSPTAADNKIAAHNTASNAHSALFNSKANATHSHTPEEAGADPAGTAKHYFNTHNTAATAHSALFAGKANSSHTHTPSQAGADPAGTASSAVNTHNTASTAHSTLLASIVPAGVIFPFAGNGTVPSSFLLCDGRAVSRTTYKELFDVIGTLYGAGNGSTTFNLPDFRGSFLRGYKSGISGAIGTKQNEGLPNITGTIPGDVSVSSFWNGVTGAFRKPAQCPNNRWGIYGYDTDNTNIEFDASKSDSIYGASTHVTPENYAVQFIIKY